MHNSSGDSKKVGKPRGEHDQQAVECWQPGVNHLVHHSMPSHSTHKNHYKLQCTAAGKPTKHSTFVSVRSANTSSSALSCRVCAKKGSQPEKVLYALADGEELIELYGVECCCLTKKECVEVCDGVVVHPNRKRWDLVTVMPHGLLVEVMGQGHNNRLVTKQNSTEDSMAVRQLKDCAYAQAAIEQGWSVLWLWVNELDPSPSRRAAKWAAQLREAVLHVRAEGTPTLFSN
jgi:hypothetical protein